jgi:four helix bundle protein
MIGKSYLDLELWQKAMDLAVECYTLTKSFPGTELYGLSGHLQRAAVSVPANVAEGQGRQHRSEFIQRLSIASGSLAEVETHIRIAQRVKYLPENKAQELLLRTGEVGRLLNGLLRYLRGRGQEDQRRSRADLNMGAQLAAARRPSTDNRSPASGNRQPASGN